MRKKIVLPIILVGMLLSTVACFQSEVDTSESALESSILSSAESVNSSSSSKLSSTQKVSQSYAPVSYELGSNTNTCSNHVLEDEIIHKATIIQKGVVRHKCANCGGFTDEYYYDLDEFVFEDKTLMYDGNEHEAFISGLIPYGCKVTYENNKIKDIGEKEATANVYDEKNNLLVSKKAKLKVIENIGIPTIKIVTETGKDPDYHDKTNYTKMTASTENCESKYVINNISGGIRARGNSTNYDGIAKHPWRLKFDSKLNLLGLNEGKKFKSWVLLAEYFDQSLLRNTTAFCLGNSLFNYSNNYSSDYKHVNLYMNGSYRGVYLLAEQQQANKNRINVAEPEEGDANEKSEKIGYLVEIDERGDDDDIYFTVKPEVIQSVQPKAFPGGGGGWPGGGGWGKTDGVDLNGVTVYPTKFAIKTDTFDNKQPQYVEKYFKSAYSSLFNCAKNGKLQIINEDNNLIDSPYNNQFDTLNSFIDLDSMFKTCVLAELMKNYDVGFGSFYMWIDLDANSIFNRITVGAPWDHDLSSGNKTYGDNSKSDNQYIKAGFGEANGNWWLYMLSQTNFYNDIFAAYYSVFTNSNVFENAKENIEYLTSAFSTDFEKDASKYKNASGRDRMQTRQYNSQKAASTYLLDWLTKRNNYLKETWSIS